MPQPVYLAHGLIENSGDDASMRVSGRSGVALAQPKTADEAVAIFVITKLQAHALGIVFAAGKAIILLQADIAGIVPMGVRFLRHKPEILSCAAACGDGVRLSVPFYPAAESCIHIGFVEEQIFDAETAKDLQFLDCQLPIV